MSAFDYCLPPERIAQRSVEPRDHSRLMIVNRQTGEWEHKRFDGIVDELREGDVLVMNNTKVFRARLRGRLVSSEAILEMFLLRPLNDREWEVLLKPGRRVRVGDVIQMGDLRATVIEKGETARVVFDVDRDAVLAYAATHGEIPIPPYVHEMPSRLEEYQTVYAREVGSVAAPTAGFHFTDTLLERVRAKGAEIHFVTLHVGLGTFRPMKGETIEEHTMHSEFVTVTSQTARAINAAKQEGRRIVAVGTTTVRTLEGVARLCADECVAEDMLTKVRIYEKKSTCSVGVVLPLEGFVGEVNLFITPGFQFRVVDALITNFHLPKSTLLVLVSAFAGREHILAAYEEAIRQQYRFFSFGDAMFIR